jgi:uncharacterized protein YqeY
MLLEKIKADITDSMRNKDATRLSTLRMLSAEITNAEIALRPSGQMMGDDQILQVIGKEAKKRRESIEIFTTSNRQDLADKEMAELKILEEYLPQQMSEEEIESIIRATVVTNPGIAFGDLMRMIVPEFKGKADGKLVSEVANRILNELKA